MKKLTGVSLFIYFCVVTAILIVGLLFYQIKNNNSNGTTGPNTRAQNKTADLANLLSSGAALLDNVEVSKHNAISDCWIIVNSKIYDISGYASAHPGGVRNIASSCGKESTQAYDTKGGRGSPHSASANQMLAQYYIGDLNQKINQSTLTQNIQKAKTNPVSAVSTQDAGSDD